MDIAPNLFFSFSALENYVETKFANENTLTFIYTKQNEKICNHIQDFLFKLYIFISI